METQVQHTDPSSQYAGLKPLYSKHCDDEIIKSLLDVFATQLRKHVESFEDQLEKGNLNGISELCHRVRGSASTFGFPEIAQQFSIIENSSAIQGDLAELRLHLKLIKRLSERVFYGIELSRDSDGSLRTPNDQFAAMSNL